MIPVFSFIAYSGTGKTTYLEKIVPELKKRGIRVAVVKHDAHDFEIDKEGKDSYRITKAGTDVTGLVSDRKSVIMENRSRTLDQIFGMIHDVDIILTEGYKTGVWPKLMLHRSGLGNELPLDPEQCLAVISDVPVEGSRLWYDIDDIKGVVDLLISKLSSDSSTQNPLAHLPFFQEVGSKTLDGLWAEGRVEEVPRNMLILEAGKYTDYLYIQLSGISSVYTLTHTGNRKVISLVGKGMILNDDIMNIRRSSIYCETYQKSQIFVIPLLSFQRRMQSDFSLTTAVISLQDLKTKRMVHQLRNTVSNISVERRMASKLWKLARDFGKETENGTEIDLSLSITFLADMLGAPRETASRACNVLVKEGLIRIDKKRITIINREEIVRRFHKK